MPLSLLIFVGLKSVLSETRIATPAFFLLSIGLVNLHASLYFEPVCVSLHVRWVSWIHTPMGFDFLSNLPVCLLIGHLAHLHLRLISLCVNLILPF